MSNLLKLVSSPSSFLLLLLIIATPIILFYSSNDGEWIKIPFHAMGGDHLLFLFRRRALRPTLGPVKRIEDIVPVFVGKAQPSASGAAPLEWKGACFYKNKAWVEFHNKTGSPFGGATLHIKRRSDEAPDPTLRTSSRSDALSRCRSAQAPHKLLFPLPLRTSSCSRCRSAQAPHKLLFPLPLSLWIRRSDEPAVATPPDPTLRRTRSSSSSSIYAFIFSPINPIASLDVKNYPKP